MAGELEGNPSPGEHDVSLERLRMSDRYDRRGGIENELRESVEAGHRGAQPLSAQSPRGGADRAYDDWPSDECRAQRFNQLGHEARVDMAEWPNFHQPLLGRRPADVLRCRAILMPEHLDHVRRRSDGNCKTHHSGFIVPGMSSMTGDPRAMVSDP